MSDFPRISPETNDTARIRRAIASIYAGTIVFNEEGIYLVNDTIDLKEYITLQGGGLNTLQGTPTSSSQIRLTTSGIPLFKIDDPLVISLALRDLGLSSVYSAAGTYGLLAEGGTGDSISNVEFRNVQFSGFHQGIRAAALSSSNWQFDNIKVDHCVFSVPPTDVEEQDMDDRHAAIYVDSANSGWRISATTLGISTNSVGLNFKRIAYTTIDSLISNGPIQESSVDPDSQAMAYVAIYFKSHCGKQVSGPCNRRSIL